MRRQFVVWRDGIFGQKTVFLDKNAMTDLLLKVGNYNINNTNTRF